MEIVIKKWGNSAALRLPAVMLDQLSIGIDSMVDVQVVENTLVIRPVPTRQNLQSLIDQMTPDNLHTAYRL